MGDQGIAEWPVVAIPGGGGGRPQRVCVPTTGVHFPSFDKFHFSSGDNFSDLVGGWVGHH